MKQSEKLAELERRIQELEKAPRIVYVPTYFPVQTHPVVPLYPGRTTGAAARTGTTFTISEQ